MSIGVRWGAATHVGCVRGVNEDAVLAAPPMFAVADGMGGHACGDVASAIAIAGIGRFEGATAVDSESVLRVIHGTNDEIRRYAEGDDGREGMGTTLAGVALTRRGAQDAVLAFNVGDSRIYRLSATRLEQISIDHSEVEELVRAGSVTETQARAHPRRHVVTRALGPSVEVNVDSWILNLVVGDRFLVCSDGLTNELEDGKLGETLASTAGPEEIAERLVALALDAGGHDNVSVVVLDIVSVDRTQAATGDDTDPRPPPLSGPTPVATDGRAEVAPVAARHDPSGPS